MGSTPFMGPPFMGATLRIVALSQPGTGGLTMSATLRIVALSQPGTGGLTTVNRKIWVAPDNNDGCHIHNC